MSVALQVEIAKYTNLRVLGTMTMIFCTETPHRWKLKLVRPEDFLLFLGGGDLVLLLSPFVLLPNNIF